MIIKSSKLGIQIIFHVNTKRLSWYYITNYFFGFRLSPMAKTNWTSNIINIVVESCHSRKTVVLSTRKKHVTRGTHIIDEGKYFSRNKRHFSPLYESISEWLFLSSQNSALETLWKTLFYKHIHFLKLDNILIVVFFIAHNYHTTSGHFFFSCIVNKFSTQAIWSRLLLHLLKYNNIMTPFDLLR